MAHGILVTYSSTPCPKPNNPRCPKMCTAGFKRRICSSNAMEPAMASLADQPVISDVGTTARDWDMCMCTSPFQKKISCVSLESTQGKTMIRSHVLNLHSFASFCVHLRSLGNFLTSRLQQELGRRKPKNLFESTIRAQDMILYITKSRFA